MKTGNCMLYKARSTSAGVPSVTARTTRPLSTLRSSHAPRLAVPRTRTVFASRAFSVAALTVANSLPDNVVKSDSLATFKKRLKTQLYHRVMCNVLATERLCTFIVALYKFYRCIVLLLLLQLQRLK